MGGNGGVLGVNMLMAQQVGKLVWLMSKVSQHSRRCWTFSCATGMKLVLGSLFTQQIYFFSPLKFFKVHLLAPGFCQQCLYRQSLLYSSEATCQILDKAYIAKIRIREKKKTKKQLVPNCGSGKQLLDQESCCSEDSLRDTDYLRDTNSPSLTQLRAP